MDPEEIRLFIMYEKLLLEWRAAARAAWSDGVLTRKDIEAEDFSGLEKWLGLFETFKLGDPNVLEALKSAHRSLRMSFIEEISQEASGNATEANLTATISVLARFLRSISPRDKISLTELP